MGKLAIDILKGAVVFAAVGALIALTLPHIATFLAAHSIIGEGLKTVLIGFDPLWPEVISLGMVGALIHPFKRFGTAYSVPTNTG